MTIRTVGLSYDREICARTSFNPPMALPCMVTPFEFAPPVSKMISRKGLSIPTETTPKRMDKTLKNMYKTILPLYLDKY